MDSIKITGTKWYVDIEYKGNIARFDGEMCVDGFYATASSLSWIKRSREISADDFPKLIDAVMQQNKKILLKCIFAMMTVVSTNDLGKGGFLWQRFTFLIGVWPSW